MQATRRVFRITPCCHHSTHHQARYVADSYVVESSGATGSSALGAVAVVIIWSLIEMYAISAERSDANTAGRVE